MNSALLFLVGVVLFAQEREVRPTRYSEYNNDGFFPGQDGGFEENAPAPGGGLITVPINDYEWILLALAGAVMMFIAFRMYQAKKA
ncbi:MAG: hypothetical protein Q4F57_02775 [Weeksellaceae bacterium]|nr:hypothetical protein [Weeksellaceae bacterium]